MSDTASDTHLKRLRSLRRRSDELLKWAGKDLRAFLNDDGLTFVRTSESLRLSDDVNVTTTCSCLMALALTGQEAIVYQSSDPNANGAEYAKNKVAAAFDKLVAAQWMSSGLTENNAFTTTLVIRTLGFLLQQALVSAELPTKPSVKDWYLNLAIVDGKAFIALLQKHEGPFWDFVWRSISDKLRASLLAFDISTATKGETRRLERSAALELQRLIEGSWIYTPERFPNADATVLAEKRTAYKRAALNYGLIADAQNDIFTPAARSLQEIAQALGSNSENFTINEYDPSPAVVYWFVDGITRAKLELAPPTWHRLANWATRQFNHQMSLVVSGNEAMMDPVSMGMAACLCAQLKSKAVGCGARQVDLQVLPSQPELEHAIKELFKHQRNGIWPKYFPLFHYPEGGSNYCFTFELLEAILVEFGQADSALLDDEHVISGLESAVTWCKKNLLRPPQAKGWNSGGSVETLEKDQPESWATAVVHMFLWELQDALSRRIQYRLLQAYNAWTAADDSKKLNDLLDIRIADHETPTSLQAVLRTQIIDPHAGLNENDLRRTGTTAARSALLFGPPGTSKTQLAKAVANELGWRLLQIDPSDFLRESLDRIYVQAANVFRDLQDLSGVVVLFDEMDALVQTRETQHTPETAAQFLTTFMLPKLTELHDHGRVIFFMATNFRDRFDPAITRPGRFDLLLCVGPPSLDEKLRRFDVFTKEKEADAKNSANAFRELTEKAPKAAVQLEFYTFDEFRGFIESLRIEGSAFADTVKAMTPEILKERVDADSESVTLQLRDLDVLLPLGVTINSIVDLDKTKIERKQIDEKKIDVTQAIRYVMDRSVSRTKML